MARLTLAGARRTRLLLAAAAVVLVTLAAQLPCAVRANGIPLDGDPLQLRYSGPNPCVLSGGEQLDTVQVPDPQNCNQYFVCCGGEPVHYACRVPSTPMPYVIYSDAKATNSFYSPTTGQCTRTPGSLNLTAISCPAGGTQPVETEWAGQVCDAVCKSNKAGNAKAGKNGKPKAPRATPASNQQAAPSGASSGQQATVHCKDTTNQDGSAGALSQILSLLGVKVRVQECTGTVPSDPSGPAGSPPPKSPRASASAPQAVAAFGGRRGGGGGAGGGVWGQQDDSGSGGDGTGGSSNGSQSADDDDVDYGSSSNGPYQRVSMTRPYTPQGLVQLKGVAVPQGGPDQTGEWQLINGPGGASSTGAVAMHAALLPGSDKVLVWARRLPGGAEYQPGMAPNGEGEIGSLYDATTGEYTVTPMRPAPFCSGQSHTPDGTVIAAGGDADVGGYLGDGLKAIRLWKKDANAWENAPVQLAQQHWYPTQLLLGDGARTLILGGYRDGENGVSSPSIEIYDHNKNTVSTLYEVSVLKEIGGLNLYPVVIQLPWVAPNLPAGSYVILLFAAASGQVMFVDPAGAVNEVAPLPAWPSPGFGSAFSAAGAHALLTLDPADGYAADYVMFGGPQFAGGACTCDAPANDKSYRLKVDQDTVTGGKMAWETEQMPGPRVMVDSVLLPDGKVLLVNGAKFGSSNGGGPGGGGQARDAEYHAWLYDPKAPNGDRFSVLAPSTIKRYYHSTALLLANGEVLVMGSEQDDCFGACHQFNPALHQYQAEVFRPPYVFSDARPEITGKSSEVVAMGGDVTVDYQGQVDGAVIMAPAAVTHQNNMNMRSVKLVVKGNKGGAVTLQMPPGGGHVAPPGWYMLFLMNGAIPCKKATWIQLTL